jgi:arylsulfatase A-like enzyme/Flp pilus assembly protein TadD
MKPSRPHKKRRNQLQVKAIRRLPRWTIWIPVGLLLIAAAAFLWRNPSAREGVPVQLSPGAARGFNVLVLTLDTTRPDHLGCYGAGDAKTPNLDHLAGRGLRFDNAFTTVPVTLPSHSSIFTGFDPRHHGVRHNGEYVLAPEQETLAEILGRAGYETAAFVSAFVLSARFGLAQGFDHFDEDIGIEPSGAVVDEPNQRPAENVTRAAVTWLQQRQAGRPFFAWVHYFDPHYPYRPPEPYASDFSEHPYDGEIAYMDHAIGTLMDALDASGGMNRTLIVAIADHGEGLDEHDESTHTRLLYSSVMHIPLIVACPGLFTRPNHVSDAVVSETDIFPTVLELLGIPVPGTTDGQSLLTCRDRLDRRIYMESLVPYLEDGWSPLFALCTRAGKYIQAPRPEFYDLQRDPHELTSLYEQAPEPARQLRDALKTELTAQLEAAPWSEGALAAGRNIDPEVRHQLESLGYLAFVTQHAEAGALADPKDMMPVMRAVDAANAWIRAGRTDRALKEIRAGVALAPRDPRALRTLGKVLLFKGDEDQAEQALRRSIESRPSVDACLMLAQLLIKQGRHAEAKPLLDQCEQLDPLHGGTCIARGDMAAMQDDFAGAIAHFRRAEEIDPHRLTATARARIQQTQARMAAGASR